MIDQNARQTSPFRAEKDSADGGAVLGLFSMRRLLLFDILANHFDRGSATTSGKVAGRPERSSPEFFLNTGVVFLPNQSAGDALETVHQGGNRDLGRGMDQPVNRIVFSLEFDQRGLEVLTDGGKDLSQILQNVLGGYIPPRLCHKDPMEQGPRSREERA